MTNTVLNSYIKECTDNGLIKIEVVMEADEGYTGEEFFVTKTKETYVFGDEESADKLINEMRQLSGFAGCDKKFKPGKVNKSGEEVKPDTWTVVVKMNH